MSLVELYDALARGGLPFLLLAIGWAGYKRFWVFGWMYDQSERRADRFEALALDLLHLANTATDAAAKGSPRDA